MADNEVKVRITGSDEASPAIKSVEGSLESLSGAAEKVSTAIELLGVGELVSRFSEFAKGALEAGADLAEMAERTGVSVEELQGLSYAAKQSGVSTETLEKGIRKLQQTITSAAQGSAKAQATLKALGVSARDANGNVTDASDAIVKIADRMSKMADGTAKAGLAVQAFGRGGTALIPLLNQGAAGIAALTARAKELGAKLDDLDEDTLVRLRNDMVDVSIVTQSLADRFLLGLAPSVNSVVKAFTQGKGLAGEFDAAREAGEVFGKTIQYVALYGLEVGYAYEYTKIKLDELAKGFLGDEAAADAFFGKIGDTRLHDLAANVDAIKKALFAPAPAPPHRPSGGGQYDVGDAEKDKADRQKDLSEEMLAFQVAQIKNELDIEKASYDTQRSALEELYKHNLITVEDYYTRKRQLNVEELNTELQSIDAEEQLYNQALQKLPQIAALEAQRVALQAKLDKGGDSKVRSQLDQVVANEKERITLETKLNALASQYYILQEKLYAAQGKTPSGQADPLAQLAESEDIATAKAKELGDQIEQAFSKLKDTIDQVKERVEEFKESGVAGQKEINGILQQGDTALQKMIDDYKQLAQASGNQQLVTNAQKYQTQLDQMNTKTKTLAETLEQSASTSLQDFFKAIENGQSASKAFDNLAKSILNDIAKIINQMIAMYIVQKLVGLAGGLGGAAAGGATNTADIGGVGQGAIDIPSPAAFASGGEPPVGLASLVGEEGPELFIPSTPGTIIPHSQVGAALNGGGAHVVQNIDLRGADSSVLQQANAYADRLAEKTFARTIVAQREIRLRRV